MFFPNPSFQTSEGYYNVSDLMKEKPSGGQLYNTIKIDCQQGYNFILIINHTGRKDLI